MLTLSAEEAKIMILESRFPTDPVQVEGNIDLSNQTELTRLPDSLKKIWHLNLDGCTSLKFLPDHLDVHFLSLNGCSELQSLPAGMTVYSLQAQGAGLIALADDLQIGYKLDLTDCKQLAALPKGLTVGSLIIAGCTALKALPHDLHLYFLDASGCTNLQTWGTTGVIEVGQINLSGCQRLTYLPEWMDRITELNIQGCENLQHLPDALTVTSHIELADSGLTGLPVGCQQTELRWKDVIINEWVAFHPEQISAQDILNERNIELRRVMLERFGYDNFFRQIDAKVLDQDVDPGGVRRLLHVEFENQNRWTRDEPLVCLSVICPSTARSYIIRVPPDVTSCRQAAAWVAGFDDPSQYNPVIET